MQPSVMLCPYVKACPGTRSWRPPSRWLSIIRPTMRASPCSIWLATSSTTSG
ncbi:Uncharacterised protein [Bordetella pertussis]|nr:Uncharacterised protein [Bordetella pertussis]CFW35947.1 Uncharacterised protein [Bordetella pertussis]